MTEEEYPPAAESVLTEIDKAEGAVSTAIGMCLARRDTHTGGLLVAISALLDEVADYVEDD